MTEKLKVIQNQLKIKSNIICLKSMSTLKKFYFIEYLLKFSIK